MEIRFDKRGDWDKKLNKWVSLDRALHLNQLRGYGNKSAPEELQTIVKTAIADFNNTMDLKHFEKLHFARKNEDVVYMFNDDADLPF